MFFAFEEEQMAFREVGKFVNTRFGIPEMGQRKTDQLALRFQAHMGAYLDYQGYGAGNVIHNCLEANLIRLAGHATELEEWQVLGLTILQTEAQNQAAGLRMDSWLAEKIVEETAEFLFQHFGNPWYQRLVLRVAAFLSHNGKARKVISLSGFRKSTSVLWREIKILS